jgi:hypothetical protein
MKSYFLLRSVSTWIDCRSGDCFPCGTDGSRIEKEGEVSHVSDSGAEWLSALSATDRRIVEQMGFNTESL